MVFDACVSDDGFIENRCSGMHPNVCTWTAKEDGIYVRYNKSGRDCIMYKWDAPTKLEER